MKSIVLDKTSRIDSASVNENIEVITDLANLFSKNVSEIVKLVLIDDFEADEIMLISNYIKKGISLVHILAEHENLWADDLSKIPVDFKVFNSFDDLDFSGRDIDALKDAGVDFSDSTQDSTIQMNIQTAVDKVYSEDEGLNFNMPEADDELDLGESTEDLSLSENSSENSAVNIEMNIESTSDELDLGDTEAPDIDLTSDVSELEQNSTLGDGDLDLNSTAEMNLAEANEEFVEEEVHTSDEGLSDEGTGQTRQYQVGSIDEEVTNQTSMESMDADEESSELDELDMDDFADDLTASELDDDLDDLDELDELGDLDELDEFNDNVQEETKEEVKFNESSEDMLMDDLTGQTEVADPVIESDEDLDETHTLVAEEEQDDNTPVDRAAMLSNLSGSELLDLRVTINELKNDRKKLLDKINLLQEEKSVLKQDALTDKADIDELKIEISILKKRHLAEVENYKHQADLSSERVQILEAKNKSYQRELERLGHKIRIDFSKIKEREQDLENQLELATIDADSKVQSRDVKILDLKRKIDSLEFNMENISIKERQSKKEKVELEDKLGKVVSTLRNSLNFLEEEMDIEEIKKNLDI